MKLIDGIFTANQAKAILLPLLRHKIHYHELVIFSNHEKDINRSNYHHERLEKLIQLRESVKEEIDFAEKTGLLLTVECQLSISLESGSPIEEDQDTASGHDS
jgi:hypothetical protein